MTVLSFCAICGVDHSGSCVPPAGPARIDGSILLPPGLKFWQMRNLIVEAAIYQEGSVAKAALRLGLNRRTVHSWGFSVQRPLASVNMPAAKSRKGGTR